MPALPYWLLILQGPLHFSSHGSGMMSAGTSFLLWMPSFPPLMLPPSWNVCLVFESPVPRLEKDWDWTRPRLEKTRPAVQVFDFWESKTRKRPVWTSEFVPSIYPFKTSPRSPKTVNIWLRNKINYAMLTKIVDFAEYYCRKFNSQPYLMFLGSF